MRPLLQTRGLDLGLQLFEAGYGRRETFFVLPVEEDAAEWWNGLERAAAPECDHRFSAGKRFDRRNAEILFAGHEESATARVEIAQLGVRDPAEELDITAGGSAQRPRIGTIAGNAQAAARSG